MSINLKNSINMDRRKFFRAVIQGSIFTSLTGVGAYLAMRKPDGSAKVCDFDFVCQNCRKNSYCQIDDASKYRMNKRAELNNG